MLRQRFYAATAEASLEKRLRRRRRLGEKLIESWIFLAGILTIVVLLGIIALLLKEGLPAFWYTPPWEFLFGTKWYPVSEPPTFGILPFFVATLLGYPGRHCHLCPDWCCLCRLPGGSGTR